jgi:hypothetical protein
MQRVGGYIYVFVASLKNDTENMNIHKNRQFGMTILDFLKMLQFSNSKVKTIGHSKKTGLTEKTYEIFI